MTVMEIVRAVRAKSGFALGKDTTRSILQTGTYARSGLIRKLKLGQYFKYEIDHELDGGKS